MDAYLSHVPLLCGKSAQQVVVSCGMGKEESRLAAS